MISGFIQQTGYCC